MTRSPRSAQSCASSALNTARPVAAPGDAFNPRAIGAYRLVHVLTDPLRVPDADQPLVELIYQKRFLARGPRIVAIGGGTGLSTLLRGLKEHTSNLTAIVAVADDGGSSGVLHEELGIPPVGVSPMVVSTEYPPRVAHSDAPDPR